MMEDYHWRIRSFMKVNDLSEHVDHRQNILRGFVEKCLPSLLNIYHISWDCNIIFWRDQFI